MRDRSVDARRWRYARQFLAIQDIERWEIEMQGHEPDEAESIKSDEAIDRLIDGAPAEVSIAVRQCHTPRAPE